MLLLLSCTINESWGSRLLLVLPMVVADQGASTKEHATARPAVASRTTDSWVDSLRPVARDLERDHRYLRFCFWVASDLLLRQTLDSMGHICADRAIPGLL